MDNDRFWQPTGANSSMRHLDRSECEGGADAAEELMTPEQREQLRAWVQARPLTDHDRALTGAKLTAPAGADY
jgi:hypothetical protein